MSVHALALLTVFSLAASAASAADGDAPRPPGAELEPESSSQVSPALGLRYPEATLPVRVLNDLWQIPAGMPAWDLDDWLAFGGTTAAVGAMMWPASPSVDVRIQRSVHRLLGKEHARLWTPIGDPLVWGAVWTATFGSLAVGFIQERSDLPEMVSLMVEAFAVAQLYQLVFKLSLGREGPENGEGLGVIYGPSASLRLFPSGTPSGHAATFYALAGVVSAYWREPLLTLALQGAGLVVCVTLVTDDYHFASDVLWGAAMGYAIGHWVVGHRARIDRRVDIASTVQFFPFLDARTGLVGLRASGAF
jgi:membrane-associated phospholipid phosphatase